LGDGWGCAEHHDRSYECWVAGDSELDSGSGWRLQARAVPWLDGKRIALGPDRLCFAEPTHWHCFRAPEVIRKVGSDPASTPDSGESWLVPIEADGERALAFDMKPVRHGVRGGCTAGYCWGAGSAFAPLCQLGSIWVPCFSAESSLETGAIATSADEVESPSEKPGACQLDELGRLWCRGPGYSHDALAQLPIRVRSSPAHSFVAWDAAGEFHQSCAIHQDCGRAARALPSCAHGARAFTMRELSALAPDLEGVRVSVRGELKLLPIIWNNQSAISCGPFTATGKPTPIRARGGGSDGFCCPAQGDAPVLLTNGQQSLMLDGSWCFGDSSRTCCSLPVFGQTVIVQGVLRWRPARVDVREGWMLERPRVCQVE
jgi:hypothetical protein